MGNENSKTKDPTQNGIVPERHENGSVNGISANITSSGLEVDVNGETVVQQNGGPPSLNLSAESTEPEYVVVESDPPATVAEVVSEVVEAVMQTEEVKKIKEEKARFFGKMFKKKAAEAPADVKKSDQEKEKKTPKEDQTDASPPAADPQLESGSRGDKAAATIIAERKEDLENRHQKTEISTQTDVKTGTHIATQTGEDDDDTTTNAAGQVEEAVVMETVAAEEESLNESVVVIAEEAVEEAAEEEDGQTVGTFIGEVIIMERSAYENLVFRAERVDVIDHPEINIAKKSVKETKQEIAAELKSITEGEIAAEENIVEESVPLGITFSLPKLVADCVESVFTALPEPTHVDEQAAEDNGGIVEEENMSEPSSDEVLSEDKGKIVAEENTVRETVPLEVASGFLKQMETESIKVVAVVSESTDTSEPIVDDLFTEENEDIAEEENNAQEAMPSEISSSLPKLVYEYVEEVVASVKSEQSVDKVITEDNEELVAWDDNIQETTSMEISSSLPKVVADCVEAVFAVDSPDFAPVNTSEPSVNYIVTEDNEELAAGHNNVQETASLEISSSLPKVVADCVEAVFAADSTDYAAVNMLEPSRDEVITEDKGEGEHNVEVEEEHNVEEPLPLEISSGCLEEVAECAGFIYAAVPKSTDFAPVNTAEPRVDEDEGEIVEDDHNVEEPVPLEISSGLPNVLADCAEFVFAAGYESTDLTPLNKSEPIDEVISEDNEELVAVENPVEEDVPVEVTTSLPKLMVADCVEVAFVAVPESPDSAALNEFQPKDKVFTDDKGEIVVEENNVEGTMPLEISFSLPKLAVDCVEADIVVVSEPADFSPVNTSEQSVDEVITEDNDLIAKEENDFKNTASLEISYCLPKVLSVDCVGAVFTSVQESNDFAAVNTSEPSVDEVITEGNGEIAAEENNAKETKASLISSSLPKVVFMGEGTRHMPVDVVLIETAEPDSNTVTPEARESNDVPSKNEELAATATETISEVVHGEPNPTPANKDTPVKELSVPLVAEIIVKVESAHKEVTTDAAVAVEDEPGISVEFSIAEALSNELITTEELQEDCLDSPDNEVKPGSIPEVFSTDENVKVYEDVIADVGPVGQAEASPVNVKGDAEVILEAAIDALTQEFKSCAITSQKLEVDYGTILDEKVICATVFVPLSGDREANLTIAEEPSKTVFKEMIEEAIDALSSEFEVVPAECVEEETGVQKSSAGGEVTGAASSEEPVEEHPEENSIPCEKDASTEALENILESVNEAISEKLEVTENMVKEPADTQEDEPMTDTARESEPCISVQDEIVEENIIRFQVLLEDSDKETPAPFVDAEEEPTDSNPIISEELSKETASPLKPPVLMVVKETNKYEVTEEIMHETDSSGDVVAANKNSEGSQIATLDEHVAGSVKAVLEAIVEEIIAEDVAAECNLVTSEEVAQETEEKAEYESSLSSTDSTQSAEVTEDASITSTDMGALLVGLKSACTSVVEESAYKLGGFNMSSQGYSITVAIHVAPKKEPQ